MYTLKPRLEIVARVIVTGIILFSTLAPTVVQASPLSLKSDQMNSRENRNREEQSETESISPFAQPTFGRSKSHRTNRSTLNQTPDVLIQCVSDYCSDTTPNVILSESFDSYWATRLHFRIVCTGENCSKKDVFYRVSVTTQYEDPWGPGSPISWEANVYARALAGEAGTGGDGTGARYAIFCGIAPAHVINECSFATSGVISAEKISGNSSAGSHFFVHTDSNSAGTGSWTRRQVKIQVSLNPFDGSVPADSASCKGDPYYCSVQGHIGDPINTNTGTMSYVVNDLEI